MTKLRSDAEVGHKSTLHLPLSPRPRARGGCIHAVNSEKQTTRNRRVRPRLRGSPARARTTSNLNSGKENKYQTESKKQHHREETKYQHKENVCQFTKRVNRYFSLGNKDPALKVKVTQNDKCQEPREGTDVMRIESQQRLHPKYKKNTFKSMRNN